MIYYELIHFKIHGLGAQIWNRIKFIVGLPKLRYFKSVDSRQMYGQEDGKVY
jgi:hypothetical protein